MDGISPDRSISRSPDGDKNCQKARLCLSLYVKVETEELIYPWQSLVAEFGGALGLFLGFSFMTIWESVEELKSFKFLKNF